MIEQTSSKHQAGLMKPRPLAGLGLSHSWGAFRTFFFLWESHFYGSVILNSSHEKCETRKYEFSENFNI